MPRCVHRPTAVGRAGVAPTRSASQVEAPPSLPAAAPAAAQLRLPRVVGMLAAGLLLANVPRRPGAGLPPVWGAKRRAAALATIFLRCGLELEFRVRWGRGGFGLE
jgi:hypothetical protein